MQVTSITLDSDTGVLRLSLDTGENYEITNPVHARTIYEKVSPGGIISDTQKFWLDKYRIDEQIVNRKRLLEKLGTLRHEIGLHSGSSRIDSTVKNGDFPPKR